MVGVTGAIIGGAIIGGVATAVTGSKAAKAQTQAAEKSAEVEKYMYDTTRADYAPWRAAGATALDALMKLYGLTPPTGSGSITNPGSQGSPVGPAPVAPGVRGGFGGVPMRQAIARIQSGEETDPEALQRFGLTEYAQQYKAWKASGTATPGTGGSAGPAAPYGGLMTSPGYEFRRDEGIKALERTASARGNRTGPVAGLSGATAKAVQRYGEGLAASEYDSYAARLAQLSGFGQSATAGTAAAGQSYAQGASQAYQAAGNARASSYANTGSAINQGLNNVMTAYMWQQNPWGKS